LAGRQQEQDGGGEKAQGRQGSNALADIAPARGATLADHLRRTGALATRGGAGGARRTAVASVPRVPVEKADAARRTRLAAHRDTLGQRVVELDQVLCRRADRLLEAHVKLVGKA